MDGGDAAGEVAVLGALEPGRRDALDQLVLRREAADAFDEVLVGIAVAGDQRADPRQDAEGIDIIEARQGGQDDPAELQAEEPPARLEDAARLGEGGVDVGDVAQAEGDRVGIDAGAGDRQLLGIAAQKFDAVQHAAVDGAVAADLDHAPGDVADDDLAGAAGPLADAEGDVAGAAGDIEHRLAAARRETIDEFELPQPVDAAAHQVVHQIVAPRHAVEDAAHESRFLTRGDPAVAEIGRLFACLAGPVPDHGGNIAR